MALDSCHVWSYNRSNPPFPIHMSLLCCLVGFNENLISYKKWDTITYTYIRHGTEVLTSRIGTKDQNRGRLTHSFTRSLFYFPGQVYCLPISSRFIVLFITFCYLSHSLIFFSIYIFFLLIKEGITRKLNTF